MRERVDQAPVRFYFEHRQRIEEWAALKTQAAAYAKTLLDEMGEEIPVPDGARLYWDRGGAYEGVVLYRPEWLVTADRPAAGIGIGWGSKPNIPQPDGPNGPWWGIWRGETAKDDALPTTLKSELRTAAAPLDLKPGNFSWWPFWKLAPPAAEGWYDQLVTWAEGLRTILLEAWNHLADPLGVVLAASTDQLAFAAAEEGPDDQ
jgi:hypothetical protein